MQLCVAGRIRAPNGRVVALGGYEKKVGWCKMFQRQRWRPCALQIWSPKAVRLHLIVVSNRSISGGLDWQRRCPLLVFAARAAASHRTRKFVAPTSLKLMSLGHTGGPPPTSTIREAALMV